MADRDDAGSAQDPAPKGLEGAIFDTVRRTVSSSVRSLLLSEEGVRTLIAAVVPKEAGQVMLRELWVLRNELLKATIAEMSRFLQRLDPAAEIQKVLAGLVFDIHVTIGVDRKKPTGSPEPAPANVPPQPAPAPAPKPERKSKPRPKPAKSPSPRPGGAERNATR